MADSWFTDRRYVIGEPGKFEFAAQLPKSQFHIDPLLLSELFLRLLCNASIPETPANRMNHWVRYGVS